METQVNITYDPDEISYLSVVEVTFHFESMNITTIVNVGDLELPQNIASKAIAIARTHILQQYGIDVLELDYESVSVAEEARIP